MSWSIRQAGVHKGTLKLRVQADTAIPMAVRDEICARIDSCVVSAAQCILIDSHGHLGDDPAWPYKGLDEMRIRVSTVPLIAA